MRPRWRCAEVQLLTQLLQRCHLPIQLWPLCAVFLGTVYEFVRSMPLAEAERIIEAILASNTYWGRRTT